MELDRVLPKLKAHRRILLSGAPGVGKSTLAASLARFLARDGAACACVSCDPGSPAFGLPGAVCVGFRRDETWTLADFEPTCSLDAVRFRLPLIQSVGRLLSRVAEDVILLDGPGVVRGVAAAELLTALVAVANIDAVVLIERGGAQAELEDELAALSVPLYRLSAHPLARAPGRRARSRQRTLLWDDYLIGATEGRIDLAHTTRLGTPPPLDPPSAWAGRQVALLQGHDCIGFGEIARLEGTTARVRVCGRVQGATALLVRDAQRGAHGLLNTAKPFAADVGYVAAAAELLPGRATDADGPRPVTKVGPFVATLVNGVFGDPLLLVRLRHGRRSLLIDLGEAGRLRARTMHEVTDVLISHAHVDHVAGFLMLLRSRIGDFPPCRIFGPPGVAGNIAGMVAGIHWDRIGSRGPRFEVTELHGGERIVRFSVTPGRADARPVGEDTTSDGLLFSDSLLQVRAAVLDHGTPVLAFALESRIEVNVRKERLVELGLRPGPWLTELKRRILAGSYDAALELPGGAERTVRELAEQLVVIRPGEKLVYATDLADTAQNRARLERLAEGAHTFYCEAAFREGDAARAAETGHLTTSACGEIAAAARVGRLVPFHFSRRYEADPQKVYDEVSAACSRTVVPHIRAREPAARARE